MSKELRTNEAIKARQIRVISQDGEQLGIMAAREGLSMALDRDLDLVEVAPQAEPPVCRIMDYGKYKYEQSKKAKEARRNQNIVNIKEVQLGLKIEDHDYNTKMRRARKFLEDKDKVKLRIIFRGREITHRELGMALIDRFTKDVQDLAKIESQPRMEGRNLIAIYSPVQDKK